MRRRTAIALFFAGATAWAADEPTPVSLRGKLVQAEGEPPVLQLPDGKRVTLTGDEPTLGVLDDDRLANDDFEVLGRWLGEGRFEVAPIHTRSMFVHQGAKRMMVTYWCDVCYIRTYTPGKCWCCQKYTDLDLRESLEE